MKKLFSNRSKVHGNMKSFAGLQKNDVPRWVIESFASSGSNDVWTLQCFMMAVFNALMFPTSVLNINGLDFLYCKEIMHLGEFDWCQAVVDDIRDKVDMWRKNRDKATPLVQGCIAFIMIYYLDNLECDDMIADFVSIPRARFFTSAIIEKIASADRDYLSDGQQKREFLAALELHDKDVDAAIIKMNEANKDIEEAQQKIVSEIKHIFGDLVGSSLNTESPRDVRRKRRAERPLGASSLNVKRKSQIAREVSPAHTNGGDDCPERSPDTAHAIAILSSDHLDRTVSWSFVAPWSLRTFRRLASGIPPCFCPRAPSARFEAFGGP
ncbi:hypothetical protein GUJ93_ZPchr0012g21794 [Zizania palustris]|uniref:Uncharacterized protein n=1 Tax=Zizania palustris TaxID=103762 RepID=A0A8J5WTA7_ZIZPA|nr:hypothetical protein GUJ93_ZPchr0012g21794 [Zizania palustris]